MKLTVASFGALVLMAALGVDAVAELPGAGSSMLAGRRMLTGPGAGSAAVGRHLSFFFFIGKGGKGGKGGEGFEGEGKRGEGEGFEGKGFEGFEGEGEGFSFKH